MDEDLSFECQVQINPGMFSTKTNTLVFTSKKFYVKAKPELTVDYDKILSVERKRWWGVNSIIAVRYSSLQGPAELKFTAASGMVADEPKTKKIYEFLQKATGKLQSTSSVDAKEYKNFDKKFGMEYFSSPYGWLSFIVVIAFGVIGGALGALCGFLASRFILKIGEKSEYSGAKKIMLILLTLVITMIIFLVLAFLLTVILMLLGFKF